MPQWKTLMVQIDYNYLIGIEKEYGSPFYLMFPEKYRKHINNFVRAFKTRYPNIIAGYSFKTNYVPALCRIAQEEGCYAEVVSEMELDLALKLGFKDIIFNGPIKREKAFAKAIGHQAIINLDSAYEVDYICKYKKEHPTAELRIGLRVNIHLSDSQGNSTVQSGLREGRFGFPSSILSETIKSLRNAGVKIVSLHGHTSSSDRAVRNYRIISDYMLAVCKEYQLNDLQYFDVGGGYFGAAPEGLDLTGRPIYEDYANVILDCVLQDQWFMQRQPTIVIEPGSSVVSNVFTYYTKVYQLKHIGAKNFVMVDGTVFDVKPTMHQNNLPHSIIQDHQYCGKGIYDVVGSTCMEKDIILHDVQLDNINAGDFIEIRGVGAYTISLTPTFINYLAPILSIEDGECKLVRKRQEIGDVINVYKI